MTIINSILKWAGGKRRIAHFLSTFSPEVIDRYFEPFLGSGALFLYLAQTRPRFKAILSDSNNELINVYRCVRDNINDLIDLLGIHESNYYRHPEQYYYYIRDTYRPANNIENACRFLFLNKTCYNGLYRVNKSGSFNVPCGTYKNPVICNRKKLHDFSDILKRTDAEIICDYYQNVTQRWDVVILFILIHHIFLRAKRVILRTILRTSLVIQNKKYWQKSSRD